MFLGGITFLSTCSTSLSNHVLAIRAYTLTPRATIVYSVCRIKHIATVIVFPCRPVSLFIAPT